MSKCICNYVNNAGIERAAEVSIESTFACAIGSEVVPGGLSTCVSLQVPSSQQGRLYVVVEVP